MLEDLLKYLGYDPTKIKTIDDFKTSFDGEFIRKSAAKDDKEIMSAITGKRIGALATKVREIAKKNGMDLAKSDVEKKDVEDIIDHVFTEMGKTNLETVTKLKADLTKTTDEKVKDLEGRLAKKESDYTQLNDLHQKTVGDFNSMKENSAKQLKDFKLGQIKDKELGGVKFKQGITTVEKLGFETAIANKYKLDLSEDEKAIVPMNMEGKKIASTKETGKFKTFAEVLEEEAKELGLLSQLPGEKKTIPPGGKTEPAGGNEQGKTQHLINPRATV